MQVLAWIGHNLVIPRGLGDYQIMVFGPSRSQKTLFMRLISEVIKTYELPLTLDRFLGATNDQNLWFVDNALPQIFSTSSPSREDLRYQDLLLRLLDGINTTVTWTEGDGKQRVFNKTQNIPIILFSSGNNIPEEIFDDPRYSERIAVAQWEGVSPVGEVTAPRVAATIYRAAKECADLIGSQSPYERGKVFGEYPEIHLLPIRFRNKKDGTRVGRNIGEPLIFPVPMGPR
jgi:hypothetical protein